MDVNDYFLMFICIVKNMFLFILKKEIKGGNGLIFIVLVKIYVYNFLNFCD